MYSGELCFDLRDTQNSDGILVSLITAYCLLSPVPRFCTQEEAAQKIEADQNSGVADLDLTNIDSGESLMLFVLDLLNTLTSHYRTTQVLISTAQHESRFLYGLEEIVGASNVIVLPDSTSHQPAA
jgi:hypothetical protein